MTDINNEDMTEDTENMTEETTNTSAEGEAEGTTEPQPIDPLELAKEYLADCEAKLAKDIGYAFEPQTIEALAYLNIYDKAEYARKKAVFKGVKNLRFADVEKEVKKYSPIAPLSRSENTGLDNPIVEKNNCYYYRTVNINPENGTPENHDRKLTNFVYLPNLILRNDSLTLYRGVVTTETGDSFNFELPIAAFNAASNFSKAFERYETLSYMGANSDLGHIKAHIASKLKELNINEVKVYHTLGAVNGVEGWLIGNDKVLTTEGIKTSLETGIAYTAKGLTGVKTGFDAGYHYQSQEAKALAREVLTALPKVSDRATFTALTGWYFANPFKAIVTEKIQHKTGTQQYWPFLYSFGSPSSGKTSINILYQQLMGIVAGARISVTGSTPHATLNSLGYSHTLPVFLDEYNRKTLEGARRCNLLADHLRDAYTFTPATKGYKDMTTQTFERVAPVSFAGESFPEDAALQGRIIAVLKKNGITSENRKAFSRLQNLDKAKFASIYAQWVMSRSEVTIETVWRESFSAAKQTVDLLTNTSEVSEVDRVAANIAVVLFGLAMYKEFALDCEVVYIPYQEVTTIVKDLLTPILDQEGSGTLTKRVKNLADDFVEWCANNCTGLAKEWVLWCKETPNLENIEDETEFLYIHVKNAYAAYSLAQSKSFWQGDHGERALKTQLKERSEYIKAFDVQKKIAGMNMRCLKVGTFSARVKGGLDIPLSPPDRDRD